MSTKIYTGMKINVRNFRELRDWRIDIQRRFEREQDNHFANLLSWNLCRFYDKMFLLPEFGIKGEKAQVEVPQNISLSSKKSLLGLASSTVEWYLRKDDGKSLWEFFHLEFSFLFARKHVLAIVHSFRNVEEWFAKQPGVERFPYWNNSDPPEEMTQRQWDKRGDIWEEAMDTGIPAKDGLLVSTELPDKLFFIWKLTQAFTGRGHDSGSFGLSPHSKTHFVPPCPRKRAEALADTIITKPNYGTPRKKPLPCGYFYELRKRRARKVRELTRAIIPRLRQFYHWQDFAKIVVPPSKIKEASEK